MRGIPKIQLIEKFSRQQLFMLVSLTLVLSTMVEPAYQKNSLAHIQKLTMEKKGELVD